MTEPNSTRNSKDGKNDSAPSLGAMEDAVKSLFRQADRKRSKRLGKPFKDRYSSAGEDRQGSF